VPTPTKPRQVPLTPEPAERMGASAEAAVALWRAVRTAVRAHVSRDQLAYALPSVADLDGRASVVLAWMAGELACPSADDHAISLRWPRGGRRSHA
jgi:hypothetical protein